MIYDKSFLLVQMNGFSLSPWMTRREAAEYLRCRVDEVDANLVPLDDHPAALPGKMRFLVMAVEGEQRVRILAGDVYSILPMPQVPMAPRERVSMATL